jgi:hypothetical protein
MRRPVRCGPRPHTASEVKAAPREMIMNTRVWINQGSGRMARAVLAALLSAMTLAATAAFAQNLSDAQLRARFILNFLRFTEWPGKTFAADGVPLGVCVLGIGDPFEGALAELQSTQASGHKIDVRTHVGTEQVGGCHLVYVPDAELAHIGAVRDAIGARPVLIVGESEAVLDRGGMIALRASGRRLAFVVKLAAARRADLNFSPQMLHAAAEVLP